MFPQSQPDTPWYQIHPTKDLGPTYTSSNAAAAAGILSDPYNPASPLKSWILQNPRAPDSNGNITLAVFDPNAPANLAVSAKGPYAGYGTLTTITIPAALAGVLNVPGGSWPPAVIAPTTAIIEGPAGPLPGTGPNGTTPANVDTLSSQAAAQAIMSAIAPLYPGATLALVMATSPGAPGGPSQYYINYAPPGAVPETRRAWYVVVSKGSTVVATLNAQALIEQTTAHGQGSPGHWTVSAAPSATPVWVFDAPPSTAPATEAVMLTPVAPLAANEALVYCYPGLAAGGNPFPGTSPQWIIQRTDVPQPSAPTDTDATVAAIYQDTQAIRSKLGA